MQVKNKSSFDFNHLLLQNELKNSLGTRDGGDQNCMRRMLLSADSAIEGGCISETLNDAPSYQTSSVHFEIEMHENGLTTNSEQIEKASHDLYHFPTKRDSINS